MITRSYPLFVDMHPHGLPDFLHAVQVTLSAKLAANEFRACGPHMECELRGLVMALDGCEEAARDLVSAVRQVGGR